MQNENKSRVGATPVGRGGLLPVCQCGGGGPGFMSHQQVHADWFDVAGIMFQGFKIFIPVFAAHLELMIDF